MRFFLSTPDFGSQENAGWFIFLRVECQYFLQIVFTVEIGKKKKKSEEKCVEQIAIALLKLAHVTVKSQAVNNGRRTCQFAHLAAVMYSWNTLALTQCSSVLTSCFFTICSVSWEDTQVESIWPLRPVCVWSLRTDILWTSQIPCRNSGWTPPAGETECVCGLGVEAGDWARPPLCLVEGYWLLVSGSESPAPVQMKNVDKKPFVSYWAAGVKPFRPFKTATLTLKQTAAR